VIDASLPKELRANNPVGGTLVLKTSLYSARSAPVIAYDGVSSITVGAGFDPGYPYKNKAGWGYYLRGRLWMLQAAGEWFYDSAGQNLYLWTAAGDSPANHTVEVSGQTGVVTLTGQNYITVTGLTAQYSNYYDFYTTGSFGVTLNDVTTYGGYSGAELVSCTSCSINHSSLLNSLRYGGHISGDGAVASGNTITNAGAVLQSPDTYEPAGLYILGKNTSVSFNDITNSGWAAILQQGIAGDPTSGANLVNTQNTITRACTLLADCGADYLPLTELDQTKASALVTSNVIIHVEGSTKGSPYSASPNTQGYGFYLDEQMHNAVLKFNTVTDADFGVFVNYGDNNSLLSNSFRGRSGSVAIREARQGTSFGNLVAGNVLESLNGAPLQYSGPVSDYRNIIAFSDYNAYCTPSSANAISISAINQSYKLADWRAAFGKDGHSTQTMAKCPKAAPSGDVSLLVKP
jgi:hypothetical protein